METKINCAGVFVALWTPIRADGKCDAARLADQVNFCKSAKLSGVMALGSTGEFPYFELDERKRILDAILRAAGDWPVIANISHVRASAAAELAEHAARAGARAAAILPPYFYQFPQEDLVEFFVRAAESCGLPVVLYNFPERAGNRISVEAAAGAAERLPIIAIKQSGSELGHHRELAQLGREKSFAVLTGADTRLAEAFEFGAVGCVSGLCNAIPEWILGAFQAATGAKPANAAEFIRSISELAETIRPLPFPWDVAAAMEARGRSVGGWKAPMSRTTAAAYRAAVSAIEKLYRRRRLGRT